MTVPGGLSNAAAEPVRLTVSELLALFGERNRDFEIIGRIDGVLADHGLRCTPPLGDTTLGRNSPIVVHGVKDADEPSEPPRPGDSAAAGHSTTPGAGTTSGEQKEAGQEEAGHEEAEPADEPVGPAALRICDVPSADLKGGLATAHPDDELSQVLTRMTFHNYSQLPVLSSPHVLAGVVSWQSIVLARARGAAETLANVMDNDGIPVVRIDADLLTCIPDIYAKDYVLVHRLDGAFCGIVTAADLTLAFGSLTGPFLRLGEIERRLRRCVDRMCPDSIEDLRKATGFKKAESSHDLVFGQIIRVFRDPDRWKRLRWSIHQQTFIDRLDEVREIRNAVAHFRPDPLTQEQRDQLNAFAGWIKNLVP